MKMRIDSFIPKTFFPKSNNLFVIPSLKSDIISLIRKIKNEVSWRKGELAAKTLLVNSIQRTVLVALHPDMEIESYQANISVIVQILEGRLKFHACKRSVIIEKGQSISLFENTKYCLTAHEDTVFLLTITTGNLYTS
jgi:quercetin dioxygenase-like cupin family protein